MTERGERVYSALAKALILARHTGARLELFLCDTDSHSGQHTLRRGHEYLRALREGIWCTDVAIDAEVASAPSLVQGLIEQLQRAPAQLVVRALERADATTAMFAWQFLRQSRTPLLLTSGRPWRATPLFAAALNTQAPQSSNVSIGGLTECLGRSCGAQVEYLISKPERLPGLLAERCYDLITVNLTAAESATTQVRRVETLLQACSADVLLLHPGPVANADGPDPPPAVRFAER